MESGAGRGGKRVEEAKAVGAMNRISTLLVLSAAFFWGLSGGIGGLLVNEGWDSLVVAFYRGAIGLLIVLLWLGLRPGGNGLGNGRLWLWSAVAGVGVTGNFVFYYASIEEGSVAVAATLMYCAPVFVYVVSILYGYERPTLGKGLAMLLVLTGVVMLTGVYETGSGGVTVVGVVAGLLSGLSYAVFIFGFKNAAPYGSPQAILVIAFTVLASLTLWPGDAGQTVAVLGTADWPMFVVLGMLGGGISFVLYIKGLNWTAPAVASMVAIVEPVTASLFGVLVLGESLGMLQLLGMGLILVTVTLLSVHSHD